MEVESRSPVRLGQTLTAGASSAKKHHWLWLLLLTALWWFMQGLAVQQHRHFPVKCFRVRGFKLSIEPELLQSQQFQDWLLL